MYLAVIHWAYTDSNKAAIDMVRMEGDWLGKHEILLRKDLVRDRALSVSRFFAELGITPAEAKRLVPGSFIRLSDEKKDDPRLCEVSGWEDIFAQVLSWRAEDFQALSDCLGMPVAVFGTPDKYQQIPSFFGRVEPRRAA